ncbi:non-ribosomal peptide synthetase [Marinomonas mediterranea]|jgi:amino acid adenylation domain|uniref:Amino acid adenylation domain protein n=1 Tax=Marinomonas mediterranea (strain ATCC 700492 / JCM 21426 / NBRC 103028 / MMB-1) TaxID=717774 RepID=F2K4D4_MARM1|nr:non-ribosomal peptide synthetase [Marinomonas mediterranea]ADZ90233.1 amino acid adenylation domain protein [Marinomonas mediterranea MMB-1]WCN16428.1 non-ribosomal peptide synthetase [Marinomonas mediterranea MMB-1]
MNSHLANLTLPDTGMALTYQQRALIGRSGRVASRAFWLNLGQVSEHDAHSRLVSLMAHQHALTTEFGVPEGFNVLRQQVQTARLNWRSIRVVDRSESLLIDAQKVFAQERPHLLSWFVSSDDGMNNRLVLVGSALTLDEGSVARIREVVVGDRPADIEPEMQYLDYAGWVTDLQEDEDADDAIAFWNSIQWSELPTVELNERLSRATTLSREPIAHSVRVPFSRTLQNTLVGWAAQWEVEPQLLGFVIWAALLQRVSGREQFQISRYHDGRDDYEELDDCFGLLQQRLPMPFYDVSTMSLKKAVTSLQPILEEQVEGQEYVQQVADSITDALPVIFQYRSQNRIEDMTADSYLSEGDRLQLQVVTTQEGDGEWCLTYDSTRYDPLSMTRLVNRLPLMLSAALAEPETALGQLNALLDDEHVTAALSSQNKGDDESIETDLNNLTGLLNRIRQQALTAPNTPAIRDGKRLVTYAELDQQSDFAAIELGNRGARPESIVALCLPRGAQWLVAALAVLKSGAAYLPLDPALPQARLQAIVADASPVVIITQDDERLVGSEDCLGESLGESLGEKCIAWAALLSASPSTEALKRLSSVKHCPNQLAYVLYTSGSTGKPKGVQVTHENILHYSQSVMTSLGLPKSGHYGLISSLMADLGNTMLFPAWLQGGCVHLLGQEESTDGAKLAAYLNQHPLDCLKIVPSHLSALLTGSDARTILPKHTLVLGGERISDTLLAELAAYKLDGVMQCRLFNHYGPTETTVGVLWREVALALGSSSCNSDLTSKGSLQRDKTNLDSLTGTLGDTRIYLLDSNLNPAVSGQIAELYIAGSNVSRGYIGAANQTAGRYLPDPFVLGERCYRTGDLAMRRADGGIDIVGRVDHQVKIRGFRLELEEIESVLTAHHTVQHCAVLLQGQGEDKGQSEQAYLVAFVVPYAGGQLDEAVLRRELVKQLPDYMVPAQMHCVTHLPLTANGKIDGNALLEQARQTSLKTYIAPRNDTEKLISDIWQTVLQQSKISVDDTFFDIGGHSLAAIKVVARMRQRFERELPTDLLFRKPSIEALAAYLDESSDAMGGLLNQGAHNSERLVLLHQPDSAEVTDSLEVKDSSEATLVVMHSHGNHFHHYEPLLNKLSDQVAVYGLRSDTEVVTVSEDAQFEYLMSDYLAQLMPLKSRVLTLTGWSLAARQMMHVAQRLIEHGFTIRSVALIDYDPNQAQEDQDDEGVQLRQDVEHYLKINDIKLQETEMKSLDAILSTEGATNNYLSGLEQILKSEVIQSVLGNDLPVQTLYKNMAQRWVLKKVFYRLDIPKLSVPLWAWSSDDNASGYRAWHALTDCELEGAHIASDHFSILSSVQLADELTSRLINGDVTQKVTKNQVIEGQPYEELA